MDDALQYAQNHQEDFVGELETLLRLPSISTDSDYAHEIKRCAQWVTNHLQRIGLDKAELVETDGHPIVYGEHIVHDDAPTVLVYGHYDVQPPDPLSLWSSPPFEPTRKDDTIYARGASDDKGQFFMHLKAVESYLTSGDELPVNLKFVLEGEEECGSVHLPGFIDDRLDQLDADVLLVSDTAMFAPDVPSLTYGLRGLAYVEVVLVGPNRDLHSGVYGGGVENPANVLARLIAGLHDEDHRITLPGFYDDVRDLTEEERATFRDLPFDEERWMEEIGVDNVRTEKGYSLLEAITARPTLDVNGIWGGYQDEGAKTVLPSKAGAKISLRLVPDQDPGKVAQQIRYYFEKNVPSSMKLDFRDLHGGQPVMIDREHPALQAASAALEEVYDRPPYFVRHGGSIPIIATFKEKLGLEAVLMGFGLDSDAIHSPNEHFGLDRFREGIEAIIRFHEHYGKKVPA